MKDMSEMSAQYYRQYTRSIGISQPFYLLLHLNARDTEHLITVPHWVQLGVTFAFDINMEPDQVLFGCSLMNNKNHVLILIILTRKIYSYIKIGDAISLVLIAMKC